MLNLNLSTKTNRLLDLRLFATPRMTHQKVFLLRQSFSAITFL